MFWMFFLSSLFQGPFESCQRIFFLISFGWRTSNSRSVVRFLKITFLPLETRREYKAPRFPLSLKEERNKGREIIFDKEACPPRSRQNKEALFVLAFA